MYTFLFILFIIVCVFLTIFVLLQQGKGDLGVSSMSGSQMLFGGSGGQNFFERVTWVLGALFMFGALGLSVLKTKEQHRSILDNVVLSKKAMPQPAQPQENVDFDALEATDEQDDITPEA